MEELFANPKDFSKRKRQAKFSTGRDRKRADSNGQSLKRQYINPLDSDSYTIEKHVCKTSNVNIGTTPFEDAIGATIAPNGISLKNRKLNCKIDHLLNSNESELKFDEKYEILSHGMKDNMQVLAEHRLNCERIYLAYYDIDELNNKYQNSLNKYQTYNKKCGLNGLNGINGDINDFELNKYIKDKHYSRMLAKTNNKHNKESYRQWLQSQLSLPKCILNYKKTDKSHETSINDFEWLLNRKGVKYDATSCAMGCNINYCNVRCFGKNYWTPLRYDDKRDYLQVDLGCNYVINAVSTRGHPLKREVNKQTQQWQIEPNCNREFVKRYRLYYKCDDYKNLSLKSNKTKGLGLGNSAKDSSLWKFEGWTDLGVFNGNKDCETEKCHILQSKRIIARYIRFVPLSRAKDGFYGQKSMRVGIYGRPINNIIDRNINDSIDSVDSMGADVRDRDNKKRICSNKELKMTEKGIPCVIISITMPSKEKNNLYSKNGYGNHRYQGIACDCRMCKCASWTKQVNPKFRRRELTLFTNKLTKIKSTNCFAQ